MNNQEKIQLLEALREVKKSISENQSKDHFFIDSEITRQFYKYAIDKIVFPMNIEEAIEWLQVEIEKLEACIH